MSFHLYRINELYSNVNGTIQFIEMSVGNFNGESFWINQSISVTQGDTTHTFRFPANLPNTFTANTTVLIATQGFANFGIVKPDFIIPDGFLFIIGEATVNFAGVDTVTYNSLPLNGLHSIDRNGAGAINSPKNFAGETGTIPGILMVGTDGVDNLTGSAGNDFLNGLGGDDFLDGGRGTDTAAFSSNRADNTINPAASGFTVSGPEGNDTLTNIERLDFQDKNLLFDLSQGQAAGNTVRLIGAAFDAQNITPEFVAIGIAFFDSGPSLGLFDNAQLLLHVSQFILNTPLFVSLAGSTSNVDFVNLVYQNVVGELPSAEERDFYVGLLQGNGGTMNQAELLVLAANSAVNETNINLVGLNQSGVEYAG